jgi:hypothetical protein
VRVRTSSSEGANSLSDGIASDVVAELVVSNLGAHVAMTSNIFVIQLVVRVGVGPGQVDVLTRFLVVTAAVSMAGP